MLSSRSRTTRYGLALLFVVLATAARMAMGPALAGRHTFSTFYLAVIGSAWCCGGGPSALALVLGAMAALAFIIDPGDRTPATPASGWIGLSLYFLVGASLIAFAEAKRGASRRAEREAGRKLRAEAAVRDGRERLRMAVESAEIGTWDFEPGAGSLRWSDRCKAIFGLPEEAEVTYDRFLGLIHPEDRDRVDRATREALDPLGSGAFGADFRCLRPGGEERRLVAKGRAGFEGDGPGRRAARFLGTVLDVTDRDRDERTIAEHVRLAEFGREVGIALTRAATPSEMLARCAEAAVHHLDAAFARIWTADEAGEVLELQASAGLYTHLDGPHGRVPVGMYKIGQIARDRKPHLTNAVVGDPLVPAQDWARAEGMVAFAGYPLVVEGRLIGVIAMFARRPLSRATLDRLGSVADEIGLGIERKRSEERLHRQREWLRVTLASVGDAVIATDTQVRVTFLNAVAEGLTGWRSAEATGSSLGAVFRIVNETTRQEVESPAARALREGAVVGLANHTVLIRKDGSELAIDDSAAPIRDESGTVIGAAVLVFRDVGRKRQAERELERSEARKAAILRAALDAIITIDHEGRVVEWNPAAEQIFGYQAGDAVGRVMAELIIPVEYQQAHHRGLAHYLDTGEGPILGRRFEITARRSGGEVFPIELAITPTPGDDPPTFTAHVRDITRRNRAERRLALQAEAGAILAGSLDDRAILGDLARLVVAGFADACYFDLAGDGDRVERVARAHADPAGEAAIDRAGRLLPPRGFDGHPTCRAIAAAATEFVPEVDDAWIRRASTGPEQAEATRALGLRSLICVPVPAPGRVLGALSFGLCTPGRSFDEADVRLAEDLGRRAGAALNNALLFREAEDANKAKDQFLAVLSHELRTPLNPILLAATAMLDRPVDPGELRPTLEMIRQNVNLQARLIDDLLDVMRIVRGKMPLHWEVADVHRLIHQAIQICRSEVFGKEVRLELDLGAAEHHVNADAARLQQVFWNLIKNAVKFSPGGGTITIRTRNRPARGGPAGGVVVEVADPGIGIDPEVLPRIFDPFQQGETTITRKFGGLGLGLAICKGVVEAHGGAIEAESAGQDRGTTFRVALDALPSPAVEPEPEPGSARPAAEPAIAATLQILVVEDEPATLRLMARLIRGLGHEVATAETIATGLETFRAGRFDLVISDIGLPDGSGLELMRKVVAGHGPVPAIALTGYGMEEDIRRSREAGFTAHLTKPIDFLKLEAMIQQVTPVRA